MGVVDLWSDRNVNKLMDAIEMTRDNLLVRRMGKERQKDDYKKVKEIFREEDTFNKKF